MAIMNKYGDRYIFHFTDIDNLDSIIKNGLLCTNTKTEKGIRHINIANMTIQERRANMIVPVGPKGTIHDYVPFYFSSINPMLLKKLNEKNIDQQKIIYFCIKIERLNRDDAVFTDASANTNTPPNFYSDLSRLDKLSWELIDSRKWKLQTDDEKHKKMAEALIHSCVNINEVDAIVVFNESVKKTVEYIFNKNGVISPTIKYEIATQTNVYSFYYTKFFFKNRERETLVTGPQTLFKKYSTLIDCIKTKRQAMKKDHSYKYRSINDLVNALNVNISILPELNDIVDLLQDYPPHNDTVDAHIKKVVKEMKQTAFFANASNDKKNIMLLASYLHDMGKGPKKKWGEGKMTRAYLDHPYDAIPMLSRILIYEIECLSVDEIRLVCMLVVYHDIIGDCICKGRDIEQIIKIIKNVDDLEMLFAIAIADSTTINTQWSSLILAKKQDFIEQILKMKAKE